MQRAHKLSALGRPSPHLGRVKEGPLGNKLSYILKSPTNSKITSNMQIVSLISSPRMSFQAAVLSVEQLQQGDSGHV